MAGGCYSPSPPINSYRKPAVAWCILGLLDPIGAIIDEERYGREIDTVIGKRGTGAIVTLERKSHYLVKSQINTLMPLLTRL